MNSVKSSDFMSPRGALAMLCHAPRARILCKKYHAGDMRARRRERMSKSFQSRRHHRHRRWPCRRCRHHRRSPPSLGPLGVSCQTLGLPRATSGFLRFPGASSTRTEMPAQPLRRAGEFPSVTAIAAASAVPNRLAGVTSAPSCASTVSYVVGGRVGMGMPCLTRSS